MSDPRTPPATWMRFVVLRHSDGSGTHFDLLIDQGETLATWKFAAPPETAAAAPLGGERIGDHRRVYLDYEGPVSGDRGHVSRHDHGTCLVADQTAAAWTVEFRGERLSGRYTLALRDGADQSWCLRSGG